MIPDIGGLRTPCYIVDLGLLRDNLKTLARVQSKAGCTILLALKGFAAWSTFPLIRETLRGVTASSLHEALLGKEEFGGEVHLCAPAYREDEFDDILACVDHIVFNSFSQWNRYRQRVRSGPRKISCGIRVNPEQSEVATAIYDPCAPKSRLGVLLQAFAGKNLEGIEGLHFHTLCELNADALERTLAAFETKFGPYIDGMKWVNFGGGHHITRKDYDVERLCRLVRDFRSAHDVKVYLEPGEAIALNTGYLAATVLDITHNQMDIAVLDTSAAAHMPDVLEMPYRPMIEGAGMPGDHPHTYRLGGLTCLAGDVIGDYSFPEPLRVGQRLVFHDMAHYSMVKNNTFNGVRLPDIVLYEPSTGDFRIVREFSYQDYKNRLS